MRQYPNTDRKTPLLCVGGYHGQESSSYTGFPLGEWGRWLEVTYTHYTLRK